MRRFCSLTSKELIVLQYTTFQTYLRLGLLMVKGTRNTFKMSSLSRHLINHFLFLKEGNREKYWTAVHYTCSLTI